ncbi:hydantoinase/oxoprolinase family protein [Elioraea sp. Yellowstone]|jgi:N-methylhydantoinase A|uniref:hydantoinase/oxoprolinase family protein n=1 Tax=Elioraea sp. Yellowstone TaxID=2592070 RepID=UPI00115358DA|nr:hydantoinase/oxoprolinase family protein [Elioraea sp. Yellowstone]TQF84170.1 hydantoinase/oxoprolinase family protein [Elioraea sp. Yellowstone]
MATTWRVGVDIGGTFTDIVLLGSDGTVHTRKISSSVDDYARAIVDGLAALLAETGIAGHAIAEVRHGTTVASNAILEHKGARTALITTRGFRDVLEIRTLRMPRLYDIAWDKPPPLVERRLRRVVDERIDARGRVERPLDPVAAEAVVRALLDEGIEAIAICLLHAYANPAHETLLAGIVRRLAPDLPLSVSSEVLPEIKEYERTSTTVINAYVMPVVARYLRRLRSGLDRAGVPARLSLMQSNGGLMAAEAAAARPMHIIESGPAGGVIGAQAVARIHGLSDIITFDMGGTTAKAATIESGVVARAAEYSVGAGIMVGSRLLTGAGYLLKVPAIDLAEVGAGGGSLVRVDAAGALKVGPESAGAVPGPVCYDSGGTEPTITDANVILGYLNPCHLVGGAVKLNADKARAVFERRVAAPLGLDLARAAHGAHLIAASNMIRAIRAVSSERGRDPRRFALFAFGGNGPLFACGMAEALGMRRVIVPPSPGLFSSFGLLYAETEHHYARSFRCLTRALDLAALNEAWESLADQALQQLAAEGFRGEAARLERTAALHYHGQSFELAVPAPDGRIDAAGVRALEEAFGAEHERTYGHRAGADEPVELVSIQVVGRGIRRDFTLPERTSTCRREAAIPQRRAYFGPASGWIETPVLRRGDLAQGADGPLIVEEYDATCLVLPGWRARIDEGANIVIDR